jgi:hypothetical protein
VLLLVVLRAETDHPTIRGLEADAAISAQPHVSALCGEQMAAWNSAMVTPHPSSMARAGAADSTNFVPPDPLRKAQPSHGPPRFSCDEAGVAPLSQFAAT